MGVMVGVGVVIMKGGGSVAVGRWVAMPNEEHPIIGRMASAEKKEIKDFLFRMRGYASLHPFFILRRSIPKKSGRDFPAPIRR